MSGTINPDGSPVLIESVVYRYHTAELEEHDSIEEAQSYCDTGEDYGTCSSVGVYVNGEPHSCGPWNWHHPLQEGPRNLEIMKEAYAEAKGWKR